MPCVSCCDHTRCARHPSEEMNVCGTVAHQHAVDTCMFSGNEVFDSCQSLRSVALLAVCILLETGRACNLWPRNGGLHRATRKGHVEKKIVASSIPL